MAGIGWGWSPSFQILPPTRVAHSKMSYDVVDMIQQRGVSCKAYSQTNEAFSPLGVADRPVAVDRRGIVVGSYDR